MVRRDFLIWLLIESSTQLAATLARLVIGIGATIAW